MVVRKTEDPSDAVARLTATITESGVAGLRVVSTRRPGDRTQSGNISYHSSGHAIDVAGSEEAMTAYSRFLAGRYGSQILELIHKDPDGTWWWINNGGPGRRGGNESLLANHRDHVHLAATNMGLNSVSAGGAGGLPISITTGAVPGVGNPVGAGSEGLAKLYGWFAAGADGKPSGTVRALTAVVGGSMLVAGLTILGKRYI